ncbi:hypothetical protein DM02DRAFT_655477 [Periconia macrospinosa]|uniref:Uncharacterized protein n=1 Tax=Periconia macrospinosa TaxID=97972 RepID=A0A2V1DQ37_9PLEO|nr:hypothetical protein DM02DRAFT_655477 [Periconia macrospinosa]
MASKKMSVSDALSLQLEAYCFFRLRQILGVTDSLASLLALRVDTFEPSFAHINAARIYVRDICKGVGLHYTIVDGVHPAQVALYVHYHTAVQAWEAGKFTLDESLPLPKKRPRSDLGGPYPGYLFATYLGTAMEANFACKRNTSGESHHPRRARPSSASSTKRIRRLPQPQSVDGFCYVSLFRAQPTETEPAQSHRQDTQTNEGKISFILIDNLAPSRSASKSPPQHPPRPSLSPQPSGHRAPHSLGPIGPPRTIQGFFNAQTRCQCGIKTG